MQAGSYPAVPVITILALLVRRQKLARDLFVGGSLAWLLSKPIKAFFARGRPRLLLDAVTIRGDIAAGLGFPSGHVAVASALATVAGPYLTTRARRTSWVLVWLVALGRVYVGVHFPLDVIGGAALGWAVGTAVHILWGAPDYLPPREAIRRAGLSPADLLALHDTRISRLPLSAEQAGPLDNGCPTNSRRYTQHKDRDHR